jgi:3-dehydroquinate synthetase
MEKERKSMRKQNLIEMEGINKNIFNPDSLGGNSIALKLVMEGMRLQPCRPGLIDSRNAILKADSVFFHAKYSCAIWNAFAKRGMGKKAEQGSIKYVVLEKLGQANVQKIPDKTIVAVLQRFGAT